jgi:hypothetical protein
MKMTTGKWLGVTLLAGTLGMTLPVAFSRDDGDGPGKEHCMRGEKGDRGDRAERFEQRQAQLHDSLNLTAEQETAWKTFTGKLTPPERPDRDEFRKDMSQPAPARMEAMLARMKTRQQQMESNLTAVKEFYATLTPAQQKVFDEEFGPRGPRRHHDKQ